MKKVSAAIALTLLMSTGCVSDYFGEYVPYLEREVYFAEEAADYMPAEENVSPYLVEVRRNGDATRETFGIVLAGDEAFSAPETVTFEEGEAAAFFPVAFDRGDVEADVTYSMTLTIDPQTGFAPAVMALDITVKGERYKPYFKETYHYYTFDAAADFEYSIPVYRTVTGKKDAIAVVAQTADPAIFEIPAEIEFLQGTDETTLLIAFDPEKMVRNTVYSLKLSFSERCVELPGRFADTTLDVMFY